MRIRLPAATLETKLSYALYAQHANWSMAMDSFEQSVTHSGVHGLCS